MKDEMKMEHNANKKARRWKNFEQLESVLLELIDELGYFPTKDFIDSKIVDDDRYIGLNYAICYRYGGFNKIKERMGFETRWQQHNKWTKEEVVRQLQEICNKLKRFPKTIEISTVDYPGLLPTIFNFGSLSSFAIDMGYEPTTRRYGYWENVKTVKMELKRMKEFFGEWPNNSDLKRHNGYALLNAMYKYHGGLVTFYKKYYKNIVSDTNRIIRKK